MDDVSITHVAFSPEFTHAVEAKQVRGLIRIDANAWLTSWVERLPNKQRYALRF